MHDVKNAKGKKACRVDPANRLVEVVNKNLKVTVSFLSDGRVEIIQFNEDGSVADKQYLEFIA